MDFCGRVCNLELLFSVSVLLAVSSFSMHTGGRQRKWVMESSSGHDGLPAHVLRLAPLHNTGVPELRNKRVAFCRRLSHSNLLCRFQGSLGSQFPEPLQQRQNKGKLVTAIFLQCCPQVIFWHYCPSWTLYAKCQAESRQVALQQNSIVPSVAIMSVRLGIGYTLGCVYMCLHELAGDQHVQFCSSRQSNFSTVLQQAPSKLAQPNHLFF